MMSEGLNQGRAGIEQCGARGYSQSSVAVLRSCMPALACRHLPKCFDNLHNLEFRKDAEGQPTKAAIGMYSGEGEYVAFASDCICDGPVENWLQVLERPAAQVRASTYPEAVCIVAEPFRVLTNNHLDTTSQQLHCCASPMTAQRAKDRTYLRILLSALLPAQDDNLFAAVS